MSSLVDTTEMYLKVILEMEEDGVPPMRARIVQRLGHSGPTVSQTVGRMERNGLLNLDSDRVIKLTEQGYSLARKVVHRHRLAERLLHDVLKLGWEKTHEEACQWEHVISEETEGLLAKFLSQPEIDPYGNPLPGCKNPFPREISVEKFALAQAGHWSKPVRLTRIGEPVQASPILTQLAKARILPGTKILVSASQDNVLLKLAEENNGEDNESATPEIEVYGEFSAHLFVLPE